LEKPHAMLGINVVAADTDSEARRIFTSHQQAFVYLRRGTPGEIPPPIADIEAFWSPAEKAMASHSLLCSVVGSAETVERGLLKFIEVTQPDELMLTGLIFDQTARLRSYEIAAKVRHRITADESKEKVTAAD
jgi:alkanesulfonate monooxygenase SsuD/methylene tetrahydromethanopterin reductase-like flavin-dependent oxidoreductase (luciferase family)